MTASQWAHMGKTKAPPIGYALAVSRLEAGAATFDASTRCAARVTYTPSAREFMLRERWCAEKRQAFDQDEREPMLARLRGEVQDGQQRVDADVLHGTWVW